MLLRRSSRTSMKTIGRNVFLISVFYWNVDDEDTRVTRLLCGLNEIIYYLTRSLTCSQWSVNGSCHCPYFITFFDSKIFPIKWSKDGKGCYTVLPSFPGRMLIFFIQHNVYGGLQCSGSMLGAGNLMLRANTRYGFHLHRAQSLEHEMDVYLAVMQENIHSPVEAWVRGPWASEGRCSWIVQI